MFLYYWLLFETNVYYAGKFGANGLSEKHTIFILAQIGNSHSVIRIPYTKISPIEIIKKSITNTKYHYYK